MSPRVTNRIKKRISCALKHGERRHAGIVLDVSKTGLFVQTSAKPRPGDEVEVALSMPGRKESVTVRARVARTKLVPPQLLTVAQGGVGLHIENAPQDYLEFVERVSQPVKFARVSILQKKEDEPPKKKGVSRHARDRLAALRERSSRVGAASSPTPRRISREKTPYTKLPRFRVRLLQMETSVSRSFIVSCQSEEEARDRVVSEMGDDWKIEGVDRL